MTLTQKDKWENKLIVRVEGELVAARERLENDLGSVLQLRPMPGAAMRITESCQDKQAKLKDVLELVQCEPKISSRIISIVNSPIYGCSRPISSLNQAVVLLGFKRLSELAVSIASKEVFEEGGAFRKEQMAIYEHSLAVAALARILAQRAGNSAEAGAAFLAGMLHDVGKLFLLDLAPETYSQIHAERHEKLSAVDLELDVFGKTHAELGKHFTSASGLPETIHRAIERHHSIENKVGELGQFVAVGNALAKHWGIGGKSSPTLCPIASTWLEENDEETVAQVRDSAEEQFTVLKSLFLD